MQNRNVQVTWNVTLTRFVSKVPASLHVVGSVVAKMLYAQLNFTEEYANAYLDIVETLKLNAQRVKKAHACFNVIINDDMPFQN